MEKKTITASDIKVGDLLYVVANNQMIHVTVQNISMDENGDTFIFDISLTDSTEIMRIVDDTRYVQNIYVLFNFFYKSLNEDNRTDLSINADKECGYIDQISVYTDPNIAYNKLRTMCLESLDALKLKYNVK